MLRLARRCLVRRKHGQTAWSPNTTSSGAAPTNGVTAQEALQIAYRPMPPSQTVEYEEDFGPSMIIHREFVSAKYRTRMATDISQLAYSDVELSKSRQQLANVMNRERRGALVGAAGEEKDRVFMHSDVDETTREVKSARYLFNEPRMQFCDRFQNFFRDRIERQRSEAGKRAGDGVNAGEENHFYFSLMEACAVLYGCTTAEARETYYRSFLGLSLDALEEEAAALRQRLADADAVGAQLVGPPKGKGEAEEDRDAVLVASYAQSSKNGVAERQEEQGDGAATTPKSSLAVVQDIIDAIPPLFPSTRNSTQPAAPAASTLPPPVPSTTPTSTQESVPHVRDDVAPLFRAYLSHARGDSPVGSYDVTTIGAHAAHAERRRWRSLMDKIAAEEYHHLTSAELEDAYRLNQQLHTVKFFDLKVGDTVREIMQLLERSSGGSGSGDRDAPVEASPSHPERRV